MKRIFFSASMLVFALVSVAQQRMIPHLTSSNGGFSSRIFIQNEGDFINNYTLQPYDQQGNRLSPVLGILSPNVVESFSPVMLFDNNSDVSHFEISGSTLSVTVSYRANSGAGSTAHVRESNQQSQRWRFFGGEWSDAFDGFAVVNTGSAATDVTVIQRDFDGNELQRVIAISALGSNAKGLYVVGGPAGSAFDEIPDSYFEVQADQPLAITLLRGTVPGASLNFLWVNEAVPLGSERTKGDVLLDP